MAKNWNWTKNDQGGQRSLTQGQRGMPASNYFNPFGYFYPEVERMLEQAFRPFSQLMATAANNPAPYAAPFVPHVDIAATDREYVIDVEIPGLQEQDIRLDVSRDGQLTVSGEKRMDNYHHDKDFQRMERCYGGFMRTLALPENADLESIEAHFHNGVLTIVAPKLDHATAHGRRIEIVSGENMRERSSRRMGRIEPRSERPSERPSEPANANPKRAA